MLIYFNLLTVPSFNFIGIETYRKISFSLDIWKIVTKTLTTVLQKLTYMLVLRGKFL